MKSKVYKYCAVPLCKNTYKSTPNKLFVCIPKKKLVRDKWLKLARLDPTEYVFTNSRIYFCEDHFDLPSDMENYMEYHIMGSVSKVRMKPDCTPKYFACQPDRQTRIFETIERIMGKAIKKEYRTLNSEESTTGSSGTRVFSRFYAIATGNVTL